MLSLQDLFPQTGPFVRREPTHAGAKARRATGHKAKPKDKIADSPMKRAGSNTKAAAKNRQAVLATAPGEHVFVVPFNKTATLIRVNADKGLAVVQSGIFEMELPLADLEPVEKQPAGK